MTKYNDTLHPWEVPPQPSRDDYRHNLGGAINYYLHNLVHKLTSVFAELVADVLSSVGTRFMKLVEPELLEYAKPMLDQMLSLPNLPGWYREYLTKIRNPEHEAGAALLGAFSTSVASSASASLVDVLTRPVAYAVNAALPTQVLSPAEAIELLKRRPDMDAQLRGMLHFYGYHDNIINMLIEISRQRLDVNTMVQALYRGDLTPEAFTGELTKRGMSQADADEVFKLTRRPLDVQDLITAWRRKTISETDFDTRMGYLGYAGTGLKIIKTDSAIIPPIGELVSMAVREAWDDTTAAKWGYDEGYPELSGEWAEKQGMSRDWIKRYWRAHWNLPSPQMAFEMMHRDIIKPEELLDFLKVADYPIGWRERLMKMSYSPYTRVDVRRMYGLGVLKTRAEVKKSYMDLGYDDEKAENMTEFTIRYEDPDGSNKVDKYKELTQSLLSKAFRDGAIDENVYRAHLSEIKYAADDIEWLVAYNQFQISLELKPDLRNTYRNEMATILERAYSKRLISKASLTESLTNLGFNARDAKYLETHADYVANEGDLEARVKAIRALYVGGLTDDNGAVAALGQLNIPGEMQEKLRREWAFDKDIKTNALSEAKLKEMMRWEVIGLETYCDELRNLGYNERYVLWLRQLWEKQHAPAAEAA